MSFSSQRLGMEKQEVQRYPEQQASLTLEYKMKQSKSNRVLSRECVGQSIQPFPRTQETTIQKDITRLSIQKSDCSRFRHLNTTLNKGPNIVLPSRRVSFVFVCFYYLIKLYCSVLLGNNIIIFKQKLLAFGSYLILQQASMCFLLDFLDSNIQIL